MIRRLAIVVFAGLFAAAAVSAMAGCPGPYSGKPERLRRAKKKDRPEATEEATNAEGPALDEKCRVNFFDKPYYGRRDTRDARRLAKNAEGVLVSVEDKEGQERISAVSGALSTLRNALKKDPYGPEPTYKMAVAYAMVGKKGCSLRLLERLVALQKMPDVADEADRVVKRALIDPAFDLFRKDANTALGQ